MNDILLNAICTILLIFTTATVVICYYQCPNKRLMYAYVAVGGCVFGWLLSVILYRLTPSKELALYLDNVPFPFIAFLPVAFFLLTLLFYNKGEYITRRMITMLSIIPICTSVIALYPPLSVLLRYDHMMKAMGPLRIAVYEWNWWFYMHTAYCYLISMASVIVAFVQHRKQHSSYTIPSVLLIVSVFLTIVGNFYSIITKSPANTTMIASGISIVILYISIANNPGVEYLSIAHKQLFHNMDNPVFILNNQCQVVELNDAAINWLNMIGFSEELPYAFSQVLSCLNERGGVVKRCFIKNTDQNIFLQYYGEMIVYTLAERQIDDKNGQKIGSYIALTDITQYSKTISRLEQVADTDQLTGIANRRMYEQKCVEMDVVKNLPLSIMIADINGLKDVNNQFGHHHGDRLVRIVARTIARVCPKNAVVARIGGDEFAMIAPRCADEDIKYLMYKVNEILKSEKNDLFTPSVSFGIATKTSFKQNLRALINEADKNMYQQKKYDRRKQV